MSRKDPYSDPIGSVINWPPRSGSVIQDYRSPDPDPKEILMDPALLKTHVGSARFLRGIVKNSLASAAI